MGNQMSKTLCIHVSATAIGKADGSAAHPYPTLVAARDALRRRKRRGKVKTPVRVLVAPGVYRLTAPLVFTPEDGGTVRCPVTWAGAGGRPLLSGARVITGWSDGMINGRPCWQAVLPEVAAGQWWFTQIFVNGRRRFRARFPKSGFFRFTGVPAAEARRDLGTNFHGAMSAHFVPGEVRAFRNLAEIEVVVPDHWYENHLRIAAVDETAHTIHFATKGHSRISRDETGRHTRFRLDHVAEACTDPGDWYLDRATGTLSYIPLPGEDYAATQVEAPALDLLLSVQGDGERRVQHLRFEFLDLRHADWELPRDNPGALQSAFQIPAAVRFVGAEDCALYACRVSQVAGWAVEILRGCHGNRIVACALHDLGGGGVKIGHEGGLPKMWVAGSHGAFGGMDSVALGWGPCREEAGGYLAGRDRVDSSATTVSDCSIHDGGLIFHSAIGVWIGDASRNRIVHNHIWNFNYSGISCGWTWGYAPAFTYDNRIEGNHIHGIGHGILSDMGAIYTLGRQAGSTVARNYIHDVHSYGYGGWGIYPDEGSSWLRIEDNVVCGTKCGGFHQHYGRDNLVRHNLFVDAIENQIQLSLCECTTPVTFVGNVVQGTGTGALWHGLGWARAVIDRNVYDGDPGRPVNFAGQSWEQWQADGRDRQGRFAAALLLDAGGAIPVPANPAALKAAGIDPQALAQVVAQAGPRLRTGLPTTLAGVPPEREVRRAIVESLFWPWPAEWPQSTNTDHLWNHLPSTVPVLPAEPQAISLTLENRGDAVARGRYCLRVIPGGAARIIGPRELRVALDPGARAALDATVVATGKVKVFHVVAIAEGTGLVDSRLHFTTSPPLIIIPRLATCPTEATLGAVLVAGPALPVAGNGRPVQASLRLARAGDRLLLRVDTADAAPMRGPKLWDGSSVELFAAACPGAAARQLILAPAIGAQGGAAQLATPTGLIAAVGVEMGGTTSADGWMLVASVPLQLLGIDPAAKRFALDLVINARREAGTALCRTHLASEVNPYSDSNHYLRVTAPETTTIKPG